MLICRIQVRSNFLTRITHYEKKKKNQRVKINRHTVKIACIMGKHVECPLSNVDSVYATPINPFCR